MKGSKIKVVIVTGFMTLLAVGVGWLGPYFIASEERAWRDKTAQQERTWTKDNVAAAFAGEVEGIILEQQLKVRWPKGLLVELENPEIRDKSKPTGIKPEKDFVIFNALANKIGLLGPCLSRRLARLYKLKSLDIRQETYLVVGDYMSLKLTDKKFWMKGYISLIEKVEQEGKDTLSALEGGKCETQSK
ncbi:MAG: hypothetical protein IIC21_11755 [Chloroflexi bacterium]|nr:hypothetical protein [Chloroflexota bacterium]